MTRNPLRRLVALFLVPGLIGDPAMVMGSAHYFGSTQGSGPAQGRPLRPLFAAQALAHPMVTGGDALPHREVKVSEIQTAVRRRDMLLLAAGAVLTARTGRTATLSNRSSGNVAWSKNFNVYECEIIESALWFADTFMHPLQEARKDPRMRFRFYRTGSIKSFVHQLLEAYPDNPSIQAFKAFSDNPENQSHVTKTLSMTSRDEDGVLVINVATEHSVFMDAGEGLAAVLLGFAYGALVRQHWKEVLAQTYRLDDGAGTIASHQLLMDTLNAALKLKPNDERLTDLYESRQPVYDRILSYVTRPSLNQPPRLVALIAAEKKEIKRLERAQKEMLSKKKEGLSLLQIFPAGGVKALAAFKNPSVAGDPNAPSGGAPQDPLPGWRIKSERTPDGLMQDLEIHLLERPAPEDGHPDEDAAWDAVKSLILMKAQDRTAIREQCRVALESIDRAIQRANSPESKHDSLLALQWAVENLETSVSAPPKAESERSPVRQILLISAVTFAAGSLSLIHAAGPPHLASAILSMGAMVSFMAAGYAVAMRPWFINIAKGNRRSLEKLFGPHPEGTPLDGAQVADELRGRGVMGAMDVRAMETFVDGLTLKAVLVVLTGLLGEAAGIMILGKLGLGLGPVQVIAGAFLAPLMVTRSYLAIDPPDPIGRTLPAVQRWLKALAWTAALSTAMAWAPVGAAASTNAEPPHRNPPPISRTAA